MEVPSADPRRPRNIERFRLMPVSYRVVVQWDPERSVWLARVPELEHCRGEGATRAEAMARAEEELDALVANAREGGAPLPPAVDDDAAAYTGEITAKVSKSLHRDL